MRRGSCFATSFPVTSSIILGVAAFGALLVAAMLFREVVIRKRALPRLNVTTGVVRKLDTIVTPDRSGGKCGLTHVHVDFLVNGQNFVCDRLWFFAGNRHGRDPGKAYTFPTGTEVGVHYDPADPRCNALIVDAPRYGVAVIAGAVGALLATLAVITAR